MKHKEHFFVKRIQNFTSVFNFFQMAKNTLDRFMQRTLRSRDTGCPSKYDRSYFLWFPNGFYHHINRFRLDLIWTMLHRVKNHASPTVTSIAMCEFLPKKNWFLLIESIYLSIKVVSAVNKRSIMNQRIGYSKFLPRIPHARLDFERHRMSVVRWWIPR